MGLILFTKALQWGSHYDHETLPSNLMCLPFDIMDNLNNVNDRAYDVEYNVGGVLRHANCCNDMCTV